jgi:hypothetical protein
MGKNTKEWGGEEYERSRKNMQKTLLTTRFLLWVLEPKLIRINSD